MARGIIIAYSVADAVGRIRLEDGRELRFGASAITGGVPMIGERVKVTKTGPHPLGGERALVVQVDARNPFYERRLAVALEQHREVREGQGQGSMLTESAIAEAHAARDADLDTERRDLEAFRARVQEENRTLAGDSKLHAVQRREARLRRSTSLWSRLTGRSAATRRYGSALRSSGIPSADVARIMSLLREGASLVALPARTFARGASKFGGLPDVPVGFSWPTSRDGRPLAFLAQLALARMPKDVCRALCLPDTGLLSFFYDAETQPWGFDPNDRGHARIFLFGEAPSALKVGHGPPELPATARFGELLVHPQEAPRLPVPDSPAFLALGLPETTRGAYTAAYWDLVAKESEANDEDADHVFGAYPVPIQSPMMEAQCALVAGGVRMEQMEDLEGKDPGELAPLLNRAEGYRLLLQLDTDSSMTWEWGDSGRLYFWMHEEDLRSGRFDAAWCVLQCP